jgi:transcription elongation factor S-II
MDNKAIAEKRDALTKAVQSGEPTTVIVGMLNDLKKGVVAKEETLRSTKIGAAVAKLKQHKTPEVARLASEVVRKWRDEVGSHRGVANPKKGLASPPIASSPSGTPTTSKHPSTTSVPPDQRTWKKDKVDISRTDQASRNNCIGLLYDGLVHLSTVPSQDILSVAAAVELAIFTSFGPEDRDSYKTKVRSLYQNLKNKSNPQLRVHVGSGQIKPNHFVKMSHEELKSAEQREKDKELESENMRKAQAAQEEKSISTALTCSKCGKKK